MIHDNLDLKLGWSCNHNCIHCVVSDKKTISTKQNFNTEEIFKIIDRYKDAKHITLTGGEPTIRNDIVDIIKYIRNNTNAVISIQTNGKGLSNIDLADEISKYIDFFYIAIHHYDSKINNFICECDTAWNDSTSAMINLLKLREKYNRKILIDTQTVISKYNMNDLENIVYFLKKLGVDSSSLTFPHAMGNAYLNWEKVIPKYSEIKSQIDKVIDNYEGFVKINDIPPCYLNNNKYYIQHAFSLYKIEEKSDRCVELVNRKIDYEPEDDFKKMIQSDLKKAKTCNNCIYDVQCSGVWKEYLNFFKDDLDLYPVLK